MNREVTCQVRQASHRIAGNVNGIATLAPLDTNRYRPAFVQLDPANQPEGLLTITYLAVGICRSKGAYPPQAMNGLEQAGLASGVVAGNEIEPATE